MYGRGEKDKFFQYCENVAQELIIQHVTTVGKQPNSSKIAAKEYSHNPKTAWIDYSTLPLFCTSLAALIALCTSRHSCICATTT
jgi:hypothetical protein